MNKILKSIELYNEDYENNNLPKQLIFNVSYKLDNLLESICNISNISKEELNKRWITWVNRSQRSLYNIEFIKSGLYTVWLKTGNTNNRVLLSFKPQDISNLYLNYTLYDKIERVNVNDLRLVSELNGILYKSKIRTIYNLGYFDNIGILKLVTYADPDHEINFDIII